MTDSQTPEREAERIAEQAIRDTGMLLPTHPTLAALRSDLALALYPLLSSALRSAEARGRVQGLREAAHEIPASWGEMLSAAMALHVSVSRTAGDAEQLMRAVVQQLLDRADAIEQEQPKC